MIKSAFKRLAHRYHPDKFGDEDDPEIIDMMTKKFQEINEAYTVLSDPIMRSDYDYDRKYHTHAHHSQYEEDDHDRDDEKRRDTTTADTHTHHKATPRDKHTNKINYFYLILKTL